MKKKAPILNVPSEQNDLQQLPSQSTITVNLQRAEEAQHAQALCDQPVGVPLHQQQLQTREGPGSPPQ
jgi:hypothetical protein